MAAPGWGSSKGGAPGWGKKPRKRRSTKKKAKPHRNLVSKFTHSVSKNTVGFIRGSADAVKHPKRTGKAIAKDYKDRYTEFERNPAKALKNHPVDFALDIASAVPIAGWGLKGAGIGLKTAKVGSKTHRVGKALSESKTLKAHDVKTGRTVEKRTSSVPTRKAGQLLFNHVLGINKKTYGAYAARMARGEISAAAVGTKHVLNSVKREAARLKKTGAPLHTLKKAYLDHENTWLPVYMRAAAAGGRRIKDPQSLAANEVLLASDNFVKNVSGRVALKRVPIYKNGKKVGSRKATYQDKLNHALSHPEKFFGTKNPGAAHVVNGEFIAVPKNVMRGVAGEYKASANVIAKAYTKTTDVWRYLVLGLRPAFLVNNVVGNTILNVLHNGGYHGVRGYYDASKEAIGARRATQQLIKGIPKKNVTLVRDFFPEHVGNAFGTEAMQGAGKYTKKLSVLPATQAIAESYTRTAAIYTKLRKNPAIKSYMRKNKVSFEKAATAIMEKDPAMRQHISNEVFQEMGQYHHLSDLERNVRSVVPFYTWQRAIARSGAKAVVHRPITVAAMAALSREGVDRNEKELGKLPSFMKGVVPIPAIGGLEEGRKSLLSTQGINPFHTLSDQADILNAVAGGERNLSETGFSQMNPLIQAFIEASTKKKLLTGQDLHGSFPKLMGGRSIENIPEYKLLESFINELKPKKKKKKRKRKKRLSLYEKSFKERGLGFAGVPYKGAGLDAAHFMAEMEEGR